MCGRYTAAKDFSELIKLVGIVMARVPFFAPRYNIAPTQLAPVIYSSDPCFASSSASKACCNATRSSPGLSASSIFCSSLSCS